MPRTEHEPWCWMNPSNTYFALGVNDCICEEPSLSDVIHVMRDILGVLRSIDNQLGQR